MGDIMFTEILPPSTLSPVSSTTASPTTAAPTTAAPTAGATVRCKDRKDNFELNGTSRRWCLWLGNKFTDPADQLKQCVRKNLTDHCPEVCQKPECFATNSPTTAALTTAAPTIRCKDRTDKFQFKPTSNTKNWCQWVRMKFPDPADHPDQCSGRNLTDHCPVLCQKPECFATDSVTTKTIFDEVD